MRLVIIMGPGVHWEHSHHTDWNLTTLVPKHVPKVLHKIVCTVATNDSWIQMVFLTFPAPSWHLLWVPRRWLSYERTCCAWPPPQGTGLSAPCVPAVVSSVVSPYEPPQDQQQSGQEVCHIPTGSKRWALVRVVLLYIYRV